MILTEGTVTGAQTKWVRNYDQIVSSNNATLVQIRKKIISLLKHNIATFKTADNITHDHTLNVWSKKFRGM